MYEAPELLPTTVAQGRGPGVLYRIEGELVPVLHLALNGEMPVFFEHHVVLWKDPDLQIGVWPMRGAFKRAVAGMPIFMADAQGQGEIAFSRDMPGHMFTLKIPAGVGVNVREHQFLAATGNMSFTPTRLRGISNILFGNSGFWLDRFEADTKYGVEGLLWLHGYGNVFEKYLATGEQIDIEPGGWVYFEDSVTMKPKVYGLKTGVFAGRGQLVFNRFTGPGKVGIQSMYQHMPTEE